MSRPYCWSIRRELWENRFLYIAPCVVFVVVMIAALLANTFGLPSRMERAAATADVMKRHNIIVTPFSLPPAPIMLTTFIVAVFYCLDALYGERRDRSILFWKSLPVSDRTVVLSKVSIPMLVLPALALLLGVIAVIVLMMHATLVLLAHRISPVPLWREFHIIQEPMVMVYGLTVHVLWYAPIYCWLLLVSAWAKRAPLLWAVLPFMAVSAFEKVAFGSMNFMMMLQYRVGGAMQEAFSYKATKNHGALDELSQLSPLQFFSRPGLWAGLLFAALCLYFAVRLRRTRQPL